MKVLVTLNIDAFQFSMPTVLRENCIRIPEIDFYSFSNPLTEEDRRLGRKFWSYPNIHQTTIAQALSMCFDVVHQGLPTSRSFAGALIARARSIGRCGHLFTAYVEPFREDPSYWHYALSIRTAGKLVAVSRAVADGVKRTFGRSVDAVIPNGVDVDFFSPEQAQPVDLEKLGISRPFAVFAGHLERRKRPDVLIELSKLVPELNFVMLGGYVHAKERDYYLRLIRERPNVKYLGLQPRELFRDLYAQAVALVFPSDLEGMPLAVLEAQALGLPVLAQPASSLPECVEEDITGWLIPADPVAAWAGRLRQVLAWSDAERNTYAARSRQATITRNSWDLIAPRYREIYFGCR